MRGDHLGDFAPDMKLAARSLGVNFHREQSFKGAGRELCRPITLQAQKGLPPNFTHDFLTLYEQELLLVAAVLSRD